MKKMKMHSPDLTDENINKLQQLFPGCVTESKDEEGEIKLSVDFDQLKQELSDHIIEGPQERYQLNWPGKHGALLTANAPIAKTLRPSRKESVDFDTTKNLFIEGDNLEALKLLQETYLGKVKMIYIDPPYNTGNDYIYEDDFTEGADEFLIRSNQKDEEGNQLIANSESNGRFHSDWLSMMYPRIKLARNLLQNDGVLFISIDDNEVHSLMRMCSEIFGQDNYIAQLAVQLNPRGRNLDKFIAKTHESILIFVKDTMNESSMFGVEKEGRMLDEYNREDENGKFRLIGLRNRNQAFNPETRPKLYYPVYVSSSGVVSLERSNDFIDEVLPDTPDGIKTCWTWGKEKVVAENNLLMAEKTGDTWRVYRKDYLNSEDGTIARTLVKSVWLEKNINNDYGKKAIKELFGSSVMSFPKSPALIKSLIKIGSNDDDIILDFFAGSATTAQAVFELNAEDGCSRSFILTQLAEECDETTIAFKEGYATIAEIGKERIRRAGQKITDSECHDDWNQDIGFRALKIDTSNMSDVYYTPDAIKQQDLLTAVDNIKPGRDNPEDMLFQVLLDWGVDLSLPIRQETIQGKIVLFVDENALIACFDPGITEDLVKELAGYTPLRVVFRDNGFVSDAVKINVDQIFKQMSPGTEVKSI